MQSCCRQQRWFPCRHFRRYQPAEDTDRSTARRLTPNWFRHWNLFLRSGKSWLLLLRNPQGSKRM
jgi:hypothetical protein